MRIVAITSVKGAPGVTTTGLLLASVVDDAVLVEADLDGSSVAVRYGLGREPGLTTLAAATSTGLVVWHDHAQDAGGVAVLVGPDAPATAVSLWRMAGDTICRRLAEVDGVAIVDCGRFRGPTLILRSTDLLLVAVAPVADQLVALSHLLPALRAATRGDLAVLLVGAGPYTATDVEASLDVEVIAHLPHDRATAEALAGGGARVRVGRSRLVRAAADLGHLVEQRLGGSSEQIAS